MSNDTQLIALAKQVHHQSDYSSSGGYQPSYTQVHLSRQLPGELEELRRDHGWLSEMFGKRQAVSETTSAELLKAVMLKHMYRLAKHREPFRSHYREDEYPAICRSIKMIDKAYRFFSKDIVPLSAQETQCFLQGYQSFAAWITTTSRANTLTPSEGYLRGFDCLEAIENDMGLICSAKVSEKLEGFLNTAGKNFSHVVRFEAPNKQWKVLFSHDHFHTLTIGGTTLRQRHSALKALLPMIEPERCNLI